MSEYPTIEESAKRYAVLWNKWNSGEMEAEEMLFQLDREGCFIEEICRDWAKIIEQPYETVLKANALMFQRNQSSTSSANLEETT